MIITENGIGCWVDGSHFSTEDANQRIIQTMNRILYLAKMPFFPVDGNDFFDDTINDAISFVNSEICGNSQYSENGHLQFEIYDNSLFLTDTENAI